MNALQVSSQLFQTTLRFLITWECSFWENYQTGRSYVTISRASSKLGLKERVGQRLMSTYSTGLTGVPGGHSWNDIQGSPTALIKYRTVICKHREHWEDSVQTQQASEENVWLRVCDVRSSPPLSPTEEMLICTEYKHTRRYISVVATLFFCLIYLSCMCLRCYECDLNPRILQSYGF